MMLWYCIYIQYRKFNQEDNRKLMIFKGFT
jgi:hypothetical protein